ncbi:MAG: hypothetical protein Q8R36_02205, partial [bacterium]|nr:hypothetical protein [bacterium]
MAQKVCYAAYREHIYIALVELKTKDGKPFCWVLYKHYRALSLPLEISYTMQIFLILKNAMKSFPHGRSGYERRFENRFWKKTTDWLHAVSAGDVNEKH